MRRQKATSKIISPLLLAKGDRYRTYSKVVLGFLRFFGIIIRKYKSDRLLSKASLS